MIATAIQLYEESAVGSDLVHRAQTQMCREAGLASREGQRPKPGQSVLFENTKRLRFGYRLASTVHTELTINVLIMTFYLTFRTPFASCGRYFSMTPL